MDTTVATLCECGHESHTAVGDCEAWDCPCQVFRANSWKEF
jgi:hypothetical protein